MAIYILGHEHNHSTWFHLRFDRSVTAPDVSKRSKSSSVGLKKSLKQTATVLSASTKYRAGFHGACIASPSINMIHWYPFLFLRSAIPYTKTERISKFGFTCKGSDLGEAAIWRYDSFDRAGASFLKVQLVSQYFHSIFSGLIYCLPCIEVFDAQHCRSNFFIWEQPWLVHASSFPSLS